MPAPTSVPLAPRDRGIKHLEAVSHGRVPQIRLSRLRPFPPRRTIGIVEIAEAQDPNCLLDRSGSRRDRVRAGIGVEEGEILMRKADTDFHTRNATDLATE